MALEDIYILLPGICDYVTWHGKMDCAGVIKSKLMR